MNSHHFDQPTSDFSAVFLSLDHLVFLLGKEWCFVSTFKLIFVFTTENSMVNFWRFTISSSEKLYNYKSLGEESHNFFHFKFSLWAVMLLWDFSICFSCKMIAPNRNFPLWKWISLQCTSLINASKSLAWYFTLFQPSRDSQLLAKATHQYSWVWAVEG